MAEVIFTAGKMAPTSVAFKDPRREAIKAVRAIIRNNASTDDEVDDALEALIELSKE